MKIFSAEVIQTRRSNYNESQRGKRDKMKTGGESLYLLTGGENRNDPRVDVSCHVTALTQQDDDTKSIKYSQG